MQQTIFRLLVLIFCLFSTSIVDARHIIGGDISYTCLGPDPANPGNNLYEFTMFIYRDCSNNGQANVADYDDPAVVTIYRGNQLILGQAVENLGINLQTRNSIPPSADPCLIIPPNVCVESGSYIFTRSLPVINDSYHIIYQRCCRNNTINNIVNPGEAGATYSIELTPEGQSLCNTSPVFNGFPPIVICANEPIDFDHSATDADGDQLVYNFCTPNLGGGNSGTGMNPGDPAACNGVAPNPACPPPYGTVNYVTPPYSASNPMGGNPIVSIDPVTGLISGVPTLQGQFVVGVCVEEFRNGQLLSIVRRDFQFNVANCEPTVIAEIEHDVDLGNKQFVVNSCGNTTVDFKNESFLEQFIQTYNWSFVIQGDTLEFDTRDVTVNFPSEGTYQGKMVVNRDLECGDSADIFVNVFPDLRADFSYMYDTCIAGPVSFTDLSVADAGPNAITDWDWSFGDGLTDTVQSPNHNYSIPGELPVNLKITDINDCMHDTTKIISYFPVPPILIIEPSSFDGCNPLDVFFNNLSIPIDDTYDIVWDFGDGNTSGEISPSHVYETPGTYTVSLDITSPIGCFTDTIFNSLIRVRPAPIADFTFSPLNPSNFEPLVDFQDLSIDAAAWAWDFGGRGNSFLQNPSFSFPDTGLQVIQLIVTHPSGCMDTIYKEVDVEPQVRYFIPNAFTPNSDDVNDAFVGKGIFDGLFNFNLSIWNRWGELVFETTDPNQGWNGTKNNSGKPAPNGVYLCIVTYNGPRGQPVKIKGYATLIR